MELIFSRRRTLSSLLVRLLTWSPWSHVSIVDASYLVIDARASDGVKRHSLDRLVSKASKIERVSVEVPDEESAIAFARSQLGKPYDWAALFGFAFRRAAWHDPGAWFCSELAEASLMAGGLDRFRLAAQRLTPGHVWMVV